MTMCPYPSGKATLFAALFTLITASIAPAQNDAPLATKGTAVNTVTPSSVNTDTVKRWLQQYVADYFSPTNHLAYAGKVGGPRGTAGLESPQAVKAGTVKGQTMLWGYGSGMADVGYHSGILLFALCDAYQATGDEYFAQIAQRTYQGLIAMSKVSPVPGFVPRGPHPDDPSAYYKNSSVDQHTLYLCGLWRFYRSALSNEDQRREIAQIITAIARRIEGHDWSIRDEAGLVDAHAGGPLLRMQPSSISALLVIQAAAWDVTGDAYWQQQYERFSMENNGQRWQVLAQEKASDNFPRWNTYHNQDVFRMETIRRIEKNTQRQTILRANIQRRAQDKLTGPYLKLFRRSDGQTGDALAAAQLKDLAEFDIRLHADVAVHEVVQAGLATRLSPERLRRAGNLQQLTLTVPAMIWHIALLGGDDAQLAQVQPMLEQTLQQVDQGQLRSAWTANYLVVAALLNLAAE